MNCVNCTREAVWLFKAAGVRETPYCNPHLPAAYRGTKFVRPVEDHPDVVILAPRVAPEAPLSEEDVARDAVVAAKVARKAVAKKHSGTIAKAPVEETPEA